MALIEVVGGQRSLVFELTTSVLWMKNLICALGTMANTDGNV